MRCAAGISWCAPSVRKCASPSHRCKVPLPHAATESPKTKLERSSLAPPPQLTQPPDPKRYWWWTPKPSKSRGCRRHIPVSGRGHINNVEQSTLHCSAGCQPLVVWVGNAVNHSFLHKGIGTKHLATDIPFSPRYQNRHRLDTDNFLSTQCLNF